MVSWLVYTIFQSSWSVELDHSALCGEGKEGGEGIQYELCSACIAGLCGWRSVVAMVPILSHHECYCH